MNRLIAFILSLLISATLAFGQGFMRLSFGGSGGGTPPISSPSKIFYTTYSSRPLFIYEPPNYDVSKPYALAIFYGGQGVYGTPTVVTNQSLGTGNGVTTTFSGNYTNGANADVLYSSVIKVNAVAVATGDRTAHFTGAGVSSSTNSYTATAGTISITFSTPPANGHAVTIDYVYSDVLADAGAPIYLQLGDEPTNMFIAVPQITSGQWSVTTEFDDVITAVDALYNINLNRVYCVGLSLGGNMGGRLMENRASTVAAVVAASGSSANHPTTWSSLSDVASFWIHGTTDGTAAYALGTLLNTANVTTGGLNFPPETYVLWNVGHSGTVWNTNTFNRKYRTDATGTAEWDWVRWVKAYSKDQSERATLHVERAEESVDVDDYRKAYRQVNALSSGALKTSLLSRLSSLYASIGNVYTIDFVTAGNESTSDVFFYNAKTSAASASSISALVDIHNNSSSIGFTQVLQLTTAGTKITSIPRLDGFYRGMAANVNDYGAVTQLTTTDGQVKFTGLNNARNYTVRVYGDYWASGITTQSELTATINATSKSRYTENNTFFPIEFKTITPSSGEIVIDLDNNQDRISRVVSIDLILEP
jgi:dienelactone hydrolase